MHEERKAAVKLSESAINKREQKSTGPGINRQQNHAFR